MTCSIHGDVLMFGCGGCYAAAHPQAEEPPHDPCSDCPDDGGCDGCEYSHELHGTDGDECDDDEPEEWDDGEGPRFCSTVPPAMLSPLDRRRNEMLTKWKPLFVALGCRFAVLDSAEVPAVRVRIRREWGAGTFERIEEHPDDARLDALLAQVEASTAPAGWRRTR